MLLQSPDSFLASLYMIFSRRVSATLALIAFGILLTIAGCDGFVSEEPSPEDQRTDEPRSLTDSLRFAPVPEGGRLVADTVSVAKSSAASRYGCIVSTLNTQDEEHTYRYRSFYLHFPPGVEHAANGETERVQFVLSSAHAPSHAEQTDTGGGVRMATCRLPKTPAARDLLKNPLNRFGVDTWIKERSKASQSSNASKASKSSCTEITYVYSCQTVTVPESNLPPDTDCELNYSYCSRYDAVDTGGGFGGGGSEGGSGGGGSGSGGDSMDGCESQEEPELGDQVCGGTEEPAEEPELTGWAKAKSIGQKALQAFNRGEDLLDPSTWKKIFGSEWFEFVNAAADGQAALNGDPVALLGVLDYAAEQFVGFGFFDMLSGLKLADRLGFSAYNDLLYAFKQSDAASIFANNISNLDLLKDFGKLDKWGVDSAGRPIYNMHEASGQSIIDNFAIEWGLPTGQMRIDHDDITMRLYKATGGSGRWTIMLNEGGDIYKFRFERIE